MRLNHQLRKGALLLRIFTLSNIDAQLSTLNSQLSTLNPSTLQLLSYFFKLGAEHIHSPVGVKVAGKRDACHAVIPAEAGEASSAFRLER
jgi:hypothetical protein